MMRDMYPASVRAVWQADDIARWLEASGPLYHQVPVIILSVEPDGAFICYEDGDAEHIPAHNFSYATWLMIGAAAVGDRIKAKIRCDGVAARREIG